LTPDEKLRRAVGGSAKKRKRPRTDEQQKENERPGRLSKTSAITCISDSVAQLGENEDAHEQLEEETEVNLNTVWKFFGFSQSRRKELPSQVNRESGIVGNINSESWTVLVNCVVDAAKTVARCLFPSNVEDLLLSAASKIMTSADQVRSHAQLFGML
jgi:hypothetical protein